MVRAAPRHAATGSCSDGGGRRGGSAGGGGREITLKLAPISLESLPVITMEQLMAMPNYHPFGEVLYVCWLFCVKRCRIDDGIGET
jgi:hypothetical protein